MFAYVDADGNITTEKPEEVKREEVNPEDIMISIPKSEEEDNLHNGKVSFLNAERGWGFINNEFGERVFFLLTDELPSTIKEGDKVQFKVFKSPKGLQAAEVQLADAVK